jgi:chemotaxis protein MotB
MSRRRRSVGHSNHERWLVSYADFITLLFAFFVVLFASSQVDKRKVGRLAAAIQGAFQNLGISQSQNSPLPMVTGGPLSSDATGMIDNGKGLAVGSLTAASRAQLNALQKQLEGTLQPELQRHEVALKAQREGLVVSLREIGFFDSGSAEIRPSSEAAVRRIAEALAAQENNIRIEGHTDNVPIHNAHFASNWELSTARATEMTQLFIMHYHFPPSRLSAAGYAEFHPVAANSTAEGRAMNRRIDIVILASAPGPADDPLPGSPPAETSADPKH